MKKWIPLLIILCIAAVLRFWDIGNIPSGIHHDEAAFGYNAYSLLQTGKDEYGKVLPLILKSFGDYKGAIYSYLTIPFVYFFGLNEVSIRLPSAFVGCFAVFLTYVFIHYITKNKILALMTAFVTAVSPVSILLSREAEPALLSTTLIMLGIYLFLLWNEKSRILLLIGSLITFIIADLSYFSPRMFLVAFFPIVIVYMYKNSSKKKMTISIGVYIVLWALTAVLSFGISGSRLSQINVFQKPDVMLPLQEKIREDGVGHAPMIVTRMYHNKVVDFGRYLIKTYAGYWDFDFLFFEAYEPKRERVPGTGVLHLMETPCLLIGLYYIVKKRYMWGVFILSWLFVTPLLLSFVTDETPNIHRFTLVSFAFYTVIACGIYETLTIVTKPIVMKAIRIGIFGAYIASVGYYMHQLFIHQPYHLPFNRGYAYKSFVERLNQYYPSYTKIVVTKGLESPYIYMLFYGKYPPSLYQASGSKRDLDYQGFDKYIFIPKDCPMNNPMFEDAKKDQVNKMLFIHTNTCQMTENMRVLDTVYWKNSSVAFNFVEWQASKSSEIKARQ